MGLVLQNYVPDDIPNSARGSKWLVPAREAFDSKETSKEECEDDKKAGIVKEDQSRFFTQKTPPPTQAKKVAPKKNPFIPSDSDDDFVPVGQKTPPPPPQPQAKTLKTFTKKNVVSKLKKPERVKIGQTDVYKNCWMNNVWKLIDPSKKSLQTFLQKGKI